MNQPAKPPIKRQYVNFQMFKLDPAWRRLASQERAAGREEFLAAYKPFESKLMLLPYSTFGLKADADIMLWRISFVVEDFQEMTSALLNTKLGAYLSTPHSFLSMTKRSSYVDKLDPDHIDKRTQIVPGQYKYIFVYPFVKSREWYLLTQEERQAMMDEHIAVGSRFPSVKLNTTYSFGLDDQDFVVAFETDIPGDFLDLVQALRETKASKHTARDTPFFFGVRQNLEQILRSVAG